MTYLPILRQPDAVHVDIEGGGHNLTRSPEGLWGADDLEVEFQADGASAGIHLRAPKSQPRFLHLRWRGFLPSSLRFYGDQWERSYGDLEWRGMVPDRLMPWYFLAFDGLRTHGYGVKTAGNSFAWWMADNDGISLWLDVRCGGMGVQLGGRSLLAATVTAREGKDGESPFEAARAFAPMLCDHPRLPVQPVYGSNNWYFCGPDTSAQKELDAAKRISDLSADPANRPYSVIDFGWTKDPGQYGPYTESNEKFPDMAGACGPDPGGGSRARNLGALSDGQQGR